MQGRGPTDNPPPGTEKEAGIFSQYGNEPSGRKSSFGRNQALILGDETQMSSKGNAKTPLKT